MTVSLVEPDRMSDVQIIKEYKAILKSLKLIKSDIKNKYDFSKSVNFPKQYVIFGMNSIFFYDKIKYLYKRINKVIAEIFERGLKYKKLVTPYKFKKVKKLFPECLWNDFRPSESDMEISELHVIINAKMKNKIKWYGQEVDHEQFEELVKHGYDD